MVEFEPSYVSGVIVDVADQICVVAAQAERKDVCLPHLVRDRSLEEPRPGDVSLALLRRSLDEGFVVEGLTYCLGAC